MVVLPKIADHSVKLARFYTIIQSLFLVCHDENLRIIFKYVLLQE
nr:MAG TPA: hypothetical protein [Caudoviricetes sp.]